MADDAVSSISGALDGRRAWRVAWLVLAVLTVSYGAPLIVVVGLKPIQAALGTDRSSIALAASLSWVGTGLGGIMMGWVADRIGIRITATFGGLMIACGLLLAATGSLWAVYIGHGLLIGLVGNGSLYAPLIIYVSRWFHRRRGSALALISSGQFVCGVIWPPVFERGIAWYGWQHTMQGFAAVVIILILPMTLLGLVSAPGSKTASPVEEQSPRAAPVLGLPPNLVQVLLCMASFLCCVPMAMPIAHLVAFCSDLGIPATEGAAMLSVMLGCAFVSRQFWGWLGDRYGGLRAILAGSIWQASAIACLLGTQNDAALFALAAANGLGFSGLIPSYVLTVRALYSSAEAAWRVPTVLFTAMCGMAFGSWFAGALYDHFGYYAPAFGSGVVFNLGNIVIVGMLVLRQHQHARLQLMAASR